MFQRPYAISLYIVSLPFLATTAMALDNPSALGLALAFNSPNFDGAITHGALGGKVGLGQSKLVTENIPQDNESFNQLHLTKGTRWPLDFVGSFTQSNDGSCSGPTAGIAATLFQEFKLPAVGARLTYSKINSDHFQSFNVASASLSISYPIYQYLTLHGSVGKINYTYRSSSPQILEFLLAHDEPNSSDVDVSATKNYFDVTVTINLPPPYLATSFGASGDEKGTQKISARIAFGI